MRSKAALSLLLAAYRLALPGYYYEFPRDYFNHPQFQTEWWYYTGNLHTPDGRRFGFELTFFRQALDRQERPAGVWDVRDVWFAHLALSDIGGGQFFHTERWNRSGPGLAGADETQRRVWNGNWQARWTESGEDLQAIEDRFQFRLTLKRMKPPVIHGTNGVSQKAEGAGHASHYFSETRLATSGTLEVGGHSFTVEGLSWMDHEFFTHQLTADQVGWDWFSLQFEDRSELMLYRLRRKDGSVDPYSSGTYVDPAGHATHIKLADFTAVPGRTWNRYPIAWTIRVASLGLDVALTTRLDQQELKGASKVSPTYWEGAIEVRGSKGGRPIEGVGYLEMTGYS